MKILVVDDDRVSLRLVAHTLEKMGYQVTVASSGLQASNKLKSDHFSIVITDWEMPGLDGIELCRQIRAANLRSYTYIIMLTGRGDREHMVEGLLAGADDFVSKPFDPNELIARLRAAERVLSLERQLLEANRRLRAVNSQLRKMSRLDPLMEIGNRLAFEEQVAEFHERAVRSGQPYGVLMCDVDLFKRYNDQYGHQNGDQVLRQVGAEIRNTIRSSDAAFRYGGEEVLILLNDQGLDRAAAVAERIRRRVEELEFETRISGQTYRVTISCGVASYPENFDAARGWRGLVECADLALYEAKHCGRNRVVVHPQEGAETGHFQAAQGIWEGSPETDAVSERGSTTGKKP